MKHLRSKIILFSMICVMLIVGIQKSAYGTLEKTQEEIDRTRAEIAEFQNLIEEFEDSINDRRAKVEELDDQLLTTERQLASVRNNLVQADADLGTKFELFSDRVRSAYIKHNVSYLEVIFQAESMADLIIWWVYLSRILNNDAQMIVDIENDQTMIRQKETEIEELIVATESLRLQKEEELRNLNVQLQEKEALLASAEGKLASELAELARLSPRPQPEPIFGVVIDNYQGARPQHGLAQASIIYEYEVEGGITRFLALFSSQPTKVGPVRSARLHSALLAKENDVAFVHAGGGGDVLEAMKRHNVRSINEIGWDGVGFSRDSSRRAPHNLYADLSSLDPGGAVQDVVMRPAYQSREGALVNEITLEFNRRHTVGYEYDREQSAFRKYVNGNPFRDASGKRIMARNIIVAYVEYNLDLFLRPTANLMGTGDIDFYSMGQHFRGTWRKDGILSPTRFYHQDGEPIELVYGQTWIHIVRAQQDQ